MPSQVFTSPDLPPVEPTGLPATLRDELEDVQRALRVERASLAELFESAPLGLVVVDDHDHVVRVNGEFCRVFGFAPEEVVGRQIAELIIPPHLREEAGLITRTVVGGRRITLETQRRHRDGRLLDVSLLATPIRVDDGSVGAYGIYQDITERKANERALRESEARYRALFDQSPVGVFLCDSALRITHCNQRLSQIVGLPYARIVGGPVPIQQGGLFPGFAHASGDQPVFYDGPYYAEGGDSPLGIAVQYAPLRDPDGRVIGGMGVVEDVSERERAERQLRAQAAELERVNAVLRERTLELEAAMQARNRLYTAMNHELRTPITAIMLYQELLLGGALGELATEQAQALERSQNAVRHLMDLVRDVLDLSRLEAGKVSLHPEEVCLPGLVRELLDTVGPLAQRHGSELLLDVEEGIPTLLTDPQRVRQILLNLVSNAAKFGGGKPIVLRCRTVEGGVSVEVIDRGIGIEELDQERIFEDFVQIGGSPEAGTGLGLAISRRLAGLLQGSLEVQSRLGEGSTFRLVLPRTASATRLAVVEEVP